MKIFLFGSLILSLSSIGFCNTYNFNKNHENSLHERDLFQSNHEKFDEMPPQPQKKRVIRGQESIWTNGAMKIHQHDPLYYYNPIDNFNNFPQPRKEERKSLFSLNKYGKKCEKKTCERKKRRDVVVENLQKRQIELERLQKQILDRIDAISLKLNDIDKSRNRSDFIENFNNNYAKNMDQNSENTTKERRDMFERKYPKIRSITPIQEFRKTHQIPENFNNNYENYGNDEDSKNIEKIENIDNFENPNIES